MTFTHTVFAECGSQSWCWHDPVALDALDDIYSSGEYPFYYVTLVYDHNNHAKARLLEYNLWGTPTTWFDGGYNTTIGGNTEIENDYIQNITQCGARTVANIDVSLNVNWLGNASMDISVAVKNNEAERYVGHLHVYVTELESSMGWNDSNGHPYKFPFLDYAFNQSISIASGKTWTGAVTWDGHKYNDGLGHDFGNIQRQNLAVIAVVFNNTWYQGYSYIQGQNPFNAYYVDNATGVIIGENSPPSPLIITGSTSGKKGQPYAYTFTSADPNIDDVYYFINWGDNTSSGWLGPFGSGESSNKTHTWNNEGTYVIKAKAKDIFGNESGWGMLTITMPLSYKPPHFFL